MESRMQPLELGASGLEDFPALLRHHGLLSPAWQTGPAEPPKDFKPTESTTILAFKFADGVLVAGDRRATSGNTVVYDRADKVLEIDRQSIMAIAGVPATAWEAEVDKLMQLQNAAQDEHKRKAAFDRVQEILSIGIGTRSIGARADAILRELTDVPILAVRHVPEFDHVIALKIRLGSLVRMKVPLAFDARPAGVERPKRMRHHEIRVRGQEQIRKD